MSTDIDWRSELDGSFGTGHDLPPGHYVAAGRAAVRRRRAASLAMVVAMVVGVGAAWASGPGGTPRGDAPVATQAPSSPSADAQTLSQRERWLRRMREVALDEAVQLGNPGALTQEGRLVLAPGAGPVLERVPNPMGYTRTQGHSLGVRVIADGTEHYALLAVFPDGSSASVVRATGDFDGWLAQAVSNQASLDVANGVGTSSGDASGQPWLVLDTAGNVTGARPNVVVQEMRSDVDLGAGFAPGSAETGAARLLVDGRPEFAVYRIVEGTLEVVPAGGDFPSMDAFIDWARQQYDSGAGLR